MNMGAQEMHSDHSAFLHLQTAAMQWDVCHSLLLEVGPVMDFIANTLVLVP